MSGLFSAPTPPAAANPQPFVSWTPAGGNKPNPNTLGYQSGLSRPSTGARVLAPGSATTPGTAYQNTALGES